MGYICLVYSCWPNYTMMARGLQYPAQLEFRQFSFNHIQLGSLGAYLGVYPTLALLTCYVP